MDLSSSIMSELGSIKFSVEPWLIHNPRLSIVD